MSKLLNYNSSKSYKEKVNKCKEIHVLTLHRKYYKETDGLKLDVGPFTKALEVRPSHKDTILCFVSLVIH